MKQFPGRVKYSQQTKWSESSRVHASPIAETVLEPFGTVRIDETVDLSRRNRLTRYLFCPPVPDSAPVPATAAPNAIRQTFHSG